MVIQAPSLANVNFLDMGNTIRELTDNGVSFFHIDIMDGHYVPNLCFPPSIVRDLKKCYPNVTAEVHMMVDRPLDYVETLKKYGADWVSFHLDSTRFVRRTLGAIRELGMKAGVVINPSQPVASLIPVLPWLDYVVFMSVEPGFSGQKFMPGSMERLEELCCLRMEQGYDFKILIDGGVDYEVGLQAAKLGADILVTGIYMVFEQPDGIAGACRRFEETFGKQQNLI